VAGVENVAGLLLIGDSSGKRQNFTVDRPLLQQVLQIADLARWSSLLAVARWAPALECLRRWSFNSEYA